MDDTPTPVSFLLAATAGLAVGAVLATAALALDGTAADTSLPLVGRLDPATARVLLASLVGAIVAVAAFALWVAVRLRALSGIAGPAAPANPLRVGVIVAALTLSVFVLGSLPVAAAGEVPHLSVLVAVASLVGAFAALLGGIQDAFGAVDVDALVERMAEEVIAVVRREAQRVGAESSGLASPDIGDGPEDGQRVPAAAKGWVTAIDAPGLLAGLPPGAHARIEVRRGQYVLEDSPLLTVRSVSDDVVDAGRVRAAITIDDVRDRDRDIELRLQELADVGEQTTPQATPDLETVREVIARLHVVLREILVRDVSPPGLADDAGRHLARPHELTTDDVLRASLDRLRVSAGHLPEIATALVEAAASLRAEAERMQDEDAARALAAFVDRTRRTLNDAGPPLTSDEPSSEDSVAGRARQRPARQTQRGGRRRR